MIRNDKLRWLVLVLSLIGLVAITQSGRSPEDAPLARPAAVRADRERVPQAAPSSVQAGGSSDQQSTRASYAFDFSLQVALTFPPGIRSRPTPSATGNPAARSALSFRGSLEQSIYQAGNKQFVGFKLSEVQLTATGNGEAQPIPQAVLAELTREELLVRTTPNGRFVSFHFPRRMPAQIQQLISGVLCAFQVVRPAGSGKIWSVREVSALGLIMVQYRQVAARTIEKRVVQLLRPAIAGTADPAALGAARVRGGQRIRLQSTGRMERLVGDEQIGISGGQLGLSIDARQQISIRLLRALPAQRSAPIASLLAGRLAVIAGSATLSAAAAGESTAALERAAIQGRTMDGLLAEIIAEGAATPSGSQAQFEARHKLALLVRHQPQATDEIRAQLEVADNEQAEVLIAALGAAGTPRAQAALAAVYSGPEYGEELRSAAMQSLIQVQKATRETVIELQRVVGDARHPRLGRSAMLILGGVVGRLQAPRDRMQALRVLDAIARRTTDREDWQLAYLAALGNAGLPEIYPRLAPYLNSANAEYRHQAVQALRRLTGSRARAALRRIADSDRSNAVRDEARHILRQTQDTHRSK